MDTTTASTVGHDLGLGLAGDRAAPRAVHRPQRLNAGLQGGDANDTAGDPPPSQRDDAVGAADVQPDDDVCDRIDPSLRVDIRATC